MSDWWDGYPWRLIQTNLREIDMRDIEAARYVAELKGFGATVAMINAAGIIASYPTQIPEHFQSPFLTGDSLSDIIAACHAAAIRVIARTDFSKVRRPLYEKHPQWAYRTSEGGIVDYNGDVHVCINGEYQQAVMPRILEEMLSRLDFDGVFFNMGGYVTGDYSGRYYGICHCNNCVRLFREASGLALPGKEDMDDPVYRRYCVFKARTQRAQHERVCSLLRGLRPSSTSGRPEPAEGRPGLSINQDAGGRGFIRQESNTALDRPLPHWQYSGSDNTRWAAGSYPGMVSSNTTVDFIDFPYRHVAVSPHQQRLRLAQSLANGGALDYYLIGRLDNHEDRSGFPAVRELFAYHAANEPAYVGLESLDRLELFEAIQIR